MKIDFKLETDDKNEIINAVIEGLKPLFSNFLLYKIEDKYMNVSELSEYLGQSKDWVYKMVANSKIPHVKTGSNLRFKKSTIDLWLHEKTKRPLQENPAIKYLDRRNSTLN